MREELSELIGYELSDPRIEDVSVAEVHVSPDMRHARVLVVAGEAARAESLLALEGARHFLRRQLARRLDLRRVPELHFESEAVPPGPRLENLLRRVRRGRPRDGGADPEKKPSE
jgi:ribosome-binding factor A